MASRDVEDIINDAAEDISIASGAIMIQGHEDYQRCIAFALLSLAKTQQAALLVEMGQWE